MGWCFCSYSPIIPLKGTSSLRAKVPNEVFWDRVRTCFWLFTLSYDLHALFTPECVFSTIANSWWSLPGQWAAPVCGVWVQLKWTEARGMWEKQSPSEEANELLSTAGLIGKSLMASKVLKNVLRLVHCPPELWTVCFQELFESFFQNRGCTKSLFGACFVEIQAVPMEEMRMTPSLHFNCWLRMWLLFIVYVREFCCR